MFRRGSQRVYQLLGQHVADPIWTERILSNSTAGTSGSRLASGTHTFSRVLLASGRLIASSARRPAGGLISLQKSGTGRQRVRRGYVAASLLLWCPCSVIGVAQAVCSRAKRLMYSHACVYVRACSSMCDSASYSERALPASPLGLRRVSW